MLLTTASPSCRNLYYRKRNLWAKSRYLLGALELFAQTFGYIITLMIVLFFSPNR